MYPYPNYGTYKIQGNFDSTDLNRCIIQLLIVGEQFDLMDGVLGMDLSPYQPGRDRRLFYHAMSSATENWVSTSNLRDRSLFEPDPSAHPELFHVSFNFY